MNFPTTLFVSPKQGGILQSSGFLDLKSLISLSQTAKSHAFDELSLILFIEHEIARYHTVHTIEEAIALWREVYRKPLLRQWLDRGRHSTVDGDNQTEMQFIPTQQMISDAAPYDVMFAKMLRIFSESQQPRCSPQTQVVNGSFLHHQNGEMVLHHVAKAGNPASVKVFLAQFPESKHLHAVKARDRYGKNVLHHAAKSGNPDCMRAVLDIYPESERSQVVFAQDRSGTTVLHCAARSGNPESVKVILNYFPESQHAELMNGKDQCGRTALHYAAYSTQSIEGIIHLYPESARAPAVHMQSVDRATPLHIVARSGNLESVRVILSLLPESQRLQLMNMQDRDERTALHHASFSRISIRDILDLLPEAHRLQAVEMRTDIGETILHLAAPSGKVESINTILELYPESERLRAVCMPTRSGMTPLHYATEAEHSLAVLLESLPTSQRFQAVCSRNAGNFMRQSGNVLFWAAHSNKLNAVCDMIRSLPESDRWQAVGLKGPDEKSLLDLIEDRNTLKSIIRLLPHSNTTDRKRLQGVLQTRKRLLNRRDKD